MSLDQAREFTAAATNSPLEAMWLAMIYLGLRSGEAAGLSWPDIDFDRKTIHIWRAISRDENGAINPLGAEDSAVRSFARPAPSSP